jgi:hypothetical protein
MIDVINKRCIYEGCNKNPTFNIQSETKGIYCFEHKLTNMINVTDKKCIYEGCIKQPGFNLPSEIKPIYCFEHKLENMINVKKKPVFMKVVLNNLVLIYSLKKPYLLF